MAFLMAFHHDWCDRYETGMIRAISGMKTGEPEHRGQSPVNGEGDLAIVLNAVIVNSRES